MRPMGGGRSQIKLNSLLRVGRQPRIAPVGLSTRVKYREFIKDIRSSSTLNAFQVEKFVINPALSRTFPWLSGFARQFQQYAIRGMCFHFRTTSTDALTNTNTNLGSVLLSTQYLTTAPDFVNKQEMDSYQYTTTNKPSRNINHYIECAHDVTPLNVLFTRTSSTEPSDTFKYDHVPSSPSCVKA